jgi:predicted DNA-binding protein
MMHEHTGREIAPISFSVSDLEAFGDEPRVRDIKLGEALGFERPRKIRELIEANLEEIEGFGLTPRLGAPIRSGKGRITEVDEYWLNEPQALLLCMFAKTKNAAEVRRQMIEVFMSYRRKHFGGPEKHMFSGELTFSQRIACASSIAGAVANRIGFDGNQQVYDEALEWAFRRLGPAKKPTPCGATPEPQNPKPAAPAPKAMLSDPLADFFADRVIFQNGARVTARAMFEAYVIWAKREDLVPISEKTFGSRAENYCAKSKGRVRFYLDCRIAPRV